MPINFKEAKIEPKKFYIKNIPEDWDDWKLFSLFHQFGLVNSVHLGTSIHAGCRFGFVAMLTLEGAEKVRKSINNGRLDVNGTTLIVKPQLRIDKNKASDQQEQNTSKVVKVDKNKKQNPSETSKKTSGQVVTPFIIPHGDLPILIETPIEILPTPSSFSAASNELELLVRPKTLDKRYTVMQKQMEVYVSSQSVDKSNAKEGFVIVLDQKIPRRGKILSRNSSGALVYLVDLGYEVKATELWLIKDSKAHAALNFHLPQAVIHCQLAGVKFENLEKISKVLRIMERFLQDPKVEFRAVHRGYSGAKNLIQLMIEYHGEVHEIQDFSTAIAEKGLCIYEQPKDRLNYTRDQLLTYRKQVIEENFKSSCLEDLQRNQLFSGLVKA